MKRHTHVPGVRPRTAAPGTGRHRFVPDTPVSLRLGYARFTADPGDVVPVSSPPPPTTANPADDVEAGLSAGRTRSRARTRHPNR